MRLRPNLSFEMPNSVEAMAPSLKDQYSMFFGDEEGCLYHLDYYDQMLDQLANKGHKAIKSPKPIAQLTNHKLSCLAVDPINNKVFVGSFDGICSLVDLAKTGTPEISRFRGHSHFIRAVSYLPGSPNITLSAGEDGRIIMRDFRSAGGLTVDCGVPFEDPNLPINGCAFLTTDMIIGFTTQLIEELQIVDGRQTYNSSKKSKAKKRRPPSTCSPVGLFSNLDNWIASHILTFESLRSSNSLNDILKQKIEAQNAEFANLYSELKNQSKAQRNKMHPGLNSLKVNRNANRLLTSSSYVIYDYEISELFAELPGRLYIKLDNQGSKKLHNKSIRNQSERRSHSSLKGGNHGAHKGPKL